MDNKSHDTQQLSANNEISEANFQLWRELGLCHPSADELRQAIVNLSGFIETLNEWVSGNGNPRRDSTPHLLQ